MYKSCENCEFECHESFKYCPNCGQNLKENLTLGLLFKNTIHNYFSVDGRLFRSFVPLLCKPGFLPNQFVKGRRLLYLHPAQFYLFASLVFFFLFSFEMKKQELDLERAIKRDVITNTNKETVKDSVHIGNSDFQVLEVNPDGAKSDITNFKLSNKKVDSLQSLGARPNQILKALGMSANPNRFERKFYSQLYKLYKYKNGAPLLETFYNYIPIALFILLPIFALFLKLAFYKKGAFAYHLVFSLYYFSFLFIVFTALVLINFVIRLPEVIKSIVFILAFIYLYIAVLHFYKSTLLASFFKTLLVCVFFFVLVIPVAIISLGVISFMFY